MLENHGFAVVRVTLEPSAKFLIQFDSVPEALLWTPAFCAFRIGGDVVRIGKTEHPLGKRIRQWNKGVSRALAGEFRKGGTNPWEAFEGRGQGERIWAFAQSFLLNCRQN
jgi:hypothetical protein